MSQNQHTLLYIQTFQTETAGSRVKMSYTSVNLSTQNCILCKFIHCHFLCENLINSTCVQNSASKLKVNGTNTSCYIDSAIMERGNQSMHSARTAQCKSYPMHCVQKKKRKRITYISSSVKTCNKTSQGF